MTDKSKRGTLDHAIARFHANVTKHDNGFWEWTGPKFRSGFGGIRYDGKLWSAHRFSFKFIGGNDLPNKKVHRVAGANKFCVNPDNLTLGDKFTMPSLPGTKEEAPKPKAKKAKGKLTEDTVREIKVMGAAGAKAPVLATNYGVSASTIRDILKGKTWKHVTINEEEDL